MPSFSFEPVIGFSTGALAKSDWRRGLEQIRNARLKGIELSALRFQEFEPLVSATEEIDVSMFEYVSVHLPSRYMAADESLVIRLAERIAARGWPLILHPDVVTDWVGWRALGSSICVENMDKRKPNGGTADQLDAAFGHLPDAMFCFDYGHARQVDPTMSHASELLGRFGDRLRQIHFSDVDSSNHHRQLNRPALDAFSRIQAALPKLVPVILETPATSEEISEQIELARAFFFPAREVVHS
jgi:hypothetical protein